MLSIISIPSVSAAGINQTTEGFLNGQETWTGTHTLAAHWTVAPGATLIVNAGSTIVIPYGKHIDVRGAICVGAVSCGAPSDASAGNPTTFSWAIPTESEYLIRGSCYGSVDAACGSGMIIRNTIDEAKTGLNFVEFENAFGYEYIYLTGGNPNAKYQLWSLMAPKLTLMVYVSNRNGSIFF